MPWWEDLTRRTTLDRVMEALPADVIERIGDQFAGLDSAEVLQRADTLLGPELRPQHRAQ